MGNWSGNWKVATFLFGQLFLNFPLIVGFPKGKNYKRRPF
jgi:hypothetical protein